MMKKYLVSGVSLIIILVILSITVLFAYSWLPAKIHYQIHKTFQISQIDDGAYVYLGIIVPQSSPYQTVKNLNIVWNGDQERKTLAAVDTIRLWDQLIGEESVEAEVEYEIILPQGKVSWEAPIETHTLLPQAGIESNHPEIKRTANELTNRSDRNDAFEIYKFTFNHLEYTEYGCEETNLSALEAFRSGIGACIGYSRLMVALCRAAGIPAQMIIGSVLPDTLFSLPQTISSGTPGGGHAWVEYNTQGIWHPADPSHGQNYTAIFAFNHNDGHHLSFGEFDQCTSVKRDLFNWATEQTLPLDDALTHFFAASGDQTQISPETTIRKTWDVRWVNTLFALAVVTYLLCKIRDLLIRRAVRDEPGDNSNFGLP